VIVNFETKGELFVTFPPEAIIAMDLGGTQMRVAWIASDDTFGPILRRPTDAKRPAEACFADQLRLIQDAVDHARSQNFDVVGVAVGAPTPTDNEGRLTPSDNLPTMGGFALGRRLAEALRLNVSVHSDANCFAMGESRGSGHVDSFCGVTLGTGLGVGMVIDGRLYRGSHGTAGEVWKSPWAGGTVEDSLSGPAVETLYLQRTGRSTTGAEIAERARKGDPIAREVYEAFGEALGNALAWIINLIDPSALALGGSVAGAWELFEPTMRKQLETHVVVFPLPPIYPSEDSDGATLRGAVYLHKTMFPETKEKT
jgi:glucokinase